ncbi:MAG: TniQ family protein [Rhodobacteraceae bacterium]|nr:TniQ family protein [Paracoccaceae bacterium]MCF8516350.1 TniQ family protein [Paracoccaceae bacterium]MCF8520700.1 TniQ family protein [Paracoccaceae bacterium]
MNHLKPILPIRSDESVLSWATRLAGLHTGGSLVPFLNDIGVKLNNLITGADAAVDRLAEMTGVDAVELRRNTPRQVDQRRYELRGNAFSVELFRGNSIGFCPMCLAEDDQAGDPRRFRLGRLNWWVRAVRTCGRHQIPLMDRKRIRWDDVAKQMSLIVPERGVDLLRLVDASVSRAPSELQDYVERRLEGQPGPAWLDGQDIDQAVRATEMLGLVLAFPLKVNLKKLSAEDWEIAARAGYPYVSRGEEGIRQALSEIHDKKSVQTGLTTPYGPQRAFGGLYRWTELSKNSKEAGPIKEVVRRFIVESMRTNYGKKFMGDAAPKTENYTINAIAKESGLDPRTLRNLMASQGVIKDWKGVIIPGSFDVEAAKSVADMAKTVISQTALPSYMNTTRGQVIMLIEMGILPRINASGLDTGNMSRGVAADVVDAFLADLHRHAVDVEDIPGGMFDIPATAQKARVTGDIIIGMIRAHEVKRIVRRTGERGYGAIHLDPEEVNVVYAPRRPEKKLTAFDASQLLGINPAVAPRLLQEWEGVRLLNGKKDGRHSRSMVDLAEIERFRKTYVTLFHLSRDTGIHHITLNQILRKRNVKPVVDPKLIKVSIYRRADLPDDLASPSP